jgi:hypothetical protein
MALSTAGATTQIVGSPTPPQKTNDGAMTVSTCVQFLTKVVIARAGGRPSNH